MNDYNYNCIFVWCMVISYIYIGMKVDYGCHIQIKYRE